MRPTPEGGLEIETQAEALLVLQGMRIAHGMALKGGRADTLKALPAIEQHITRLEGHVDATELTGDWESCLYPTGGSARFVVQSIALAANLHPHPETRANGRLAQVEYEMRLREMPGSNGPSGAVA